MSDQLISLICQSGILILLSAFCSFSDATVVALTDFKVKNISAKHPKIGKSLQAILKDQPKYLSSIITANTIVNVGGSAYIGAVSMSFQSQDDHIKYVCILTIAMLMLAEIKPKITAAQRPEIIAPVVCVPVKIITFILSPFVNAMNGLLGNKPNEKNMSISEMEHYICTAREYGLIQKDEAQILGNVVGLRLEKAKNVANYENIEKINVSASYDEVSDFILNYSERRRIVVVNIEEKPIGVVKKEEILKAIIDHKNGDANFKLVDLIHALPVVHEECSLPALAIKLTASKTHLAAVADDEREKFGVVSLSDIQSITFKQEEVS